MPRIKKPIVSEGVYRLADGQIAVVPAGRINHWASEGNRFLQAGNKIPLPWSHIDPTTGAPVVMGPHLERSDINGGFWEALESIYVPDINPATGQPYGQTLVGYADVPGDPADPTTPAGKLGTTVKETSIYAKDFIDGSGKAFRDVPLHIAGVTHAIQPGQPNFAIAMSQYVGSTSMAFPPSGDKKPPAASGGDNSKAPPTSGGGDDQGKQPPGTPPQTATNPDINAVIENLRTCGIVLPQDTTVQNFFERLMVALGQKAVSDGGGEDPNGTLNQPPEGADSKQPAPVAMSNVAITAENFAAIPKEVFMSHPAAKALDDTNQLLLGMLLGQAKSIRKARIDALVAAHPALADHAKTVLEPMLEGLQMSFKADAPKQAIDAALDSLEIALPKKTPQASARAGLLSQLGIAMSHEANGANPFIVEPPDGEALSSDDVVKRFFEGTGGV
jgi:hypothetical protein